MVDRRRSSDRVVSEWLLGLLVACAVCGLCSLVVTAATSVGLLDTAARQRELTNVQRAIQKERRSNTLRSCRQQNSRNVAAYTFLRALPPTPGQPRQSPADREKLLRGFTDALVGPVVKDCAKVTRSRVRA